MTHIVTFLLLAIIKEWHEKGLVRNVTSEKYKGRIGLFEKTNFFHGKEKYAH